MTAFEADAPNAPIKMSRNGSIRSAKLVADDTTAPATNPIWTAIVNQLDWTSDSSHATRS